VFEKFGRCRPETARSSQALLRSTRHEPKMVYQKRDDIMRESSPAEPPALTRMQTNILAAAERALLLRICGLLPRWMRPDHLTTIGMLGSVAIFAGYAGSNFGAGWLLLSLAGYFIQWFGDSLDGSLARFRQIERPSYGYFLDHSCDGVTTFLILAGIGVSPYVRMDVALLGLVGYLLLSVHAFLCARILGELKLTYAAAGPTELRVMLIVLTVAMILLGPAPGMFGPVSGFDLFLGTVGFALYLLFIWHTVGVARRLAKMDPASAC
jgi:phosphatidylglycerophosphate synthase